jgi:single-stranded-DNA-specific exonuclease
MNDKWQLLPTQEIPLWFLEAVKAYTPESMGTYAAQLLWQRGIQNPQDLIGFINSNLYQPTPPSAFGQEMKWAIQRLSRALENREKITIWGDFDADGVTATSVLWEGLGQFFSQQELLNYYIPHRLKESHGLNERGLDRLAQAGTTLIITCDTGSTNLAEIDRARQLGIDIIVTDHHTLPDERPNVVAIINPRYFADNHPLYNLSGVGVAYKLVEALYLAFPNFPQQPLESLLDLVAIGSIADLVELKGDSRYLAQKGLQLLKNSPRLGVARLLELCRLTGDRPADVGYGIGPRINAASRIHGDSSFCVEFLTTKERNRVNQLAETIEVANTRRQELENNILKQVKKKVDRLDISTTSVIVLEDPQWNGGVLGLVAGKIAQEYQRPTILLNNDGKFARGSARSINNIDLYELVKSQSHLLHKFGGHPFAAGLSLPLENLALFKEGIDRELKLQFDNFQTISSPLQIDLVVTVAELGKNLYQELKLLEPYGMGNPPPKLLIKNCWFEGVKNKLRQDTRGKNVKHPLVNFQIWDNSTTTGFPGHWWGHNWSELSPDCLYDAIVEIELNTFKRKLEVRLLHLFSQKKELKLEEQNVENILIDLRNNLQELPKIIGHRDCIAITTCPNCWNELHERYQQAINSHLPLVLAYDRPQFPKIEEIWEKVVGVVKYLSRTGNTISKSQLQEELKLSNRSFELAIEALDYLGFGLDSIDENCNFYWFENNDDLLNNNKNYPERVERFLDSVAEEQFQTEYFYQIDLKIIEKVLVKKVS